VICTGSSEPHLRAIVDEITEKLLVEHRVRPRAVDGTLAASWIVLDYLDVMVHVMRTDTRQRYALEDLWGDATRLRLRRLPRARPASIPLPPFLCPRPLPTAPVDGQRNGGKGMHDKLEPLGANRRPTSLATALSEAVRCIPRLPVL
jgi:hypothetical protein